MRAARVGVNCWKYGMLSAFVALLTGCGGRPAGDEALDDGTARAVVDGLRARYQVAVGPGSLARRPGAGAGLLCAGRARRRGTPRAVERA
jgi:hypothetical protein